MTVQGFRDPRCNFSVELYKGSWICRVTLPSDLPAEHYPDAMAACLMWREANRQKFMQSAALEERGRP